MTQKLVLAGDTNLVGVFEPGVPFARLAEEFHAADFTFANLECCLYEPPRDAGGTATQDGYFAPPGPAGEALKLAGIQAVGIGNNVVYGDDAILSTVAGLDALGILHTGAGRNAAAARAPVILERNGLRVGFLQRTAVYWPSNHEAKRDLPGVAAMRGNTAYQLPLHKTRPGMTACNRPGLPPVIVTWIDPPYLKSFREEVAALRAQCDVLVASCHWGWKQDVLEYMTEWAHAAIDAGADIVLGHGPHYILPVEVYAGKPVFYGLGNFSFNVRGDGSKAGDWLGTFARVELEDKALKRATLQFIRHDERNLTVPRTPAQEAAGLQDLVERSAALGARLTPRGDEIEIELN
ncbi:CapA family protein [Ramlibacter sp. G-1-2-2]|uniref:CapA family protein n=1 Tax=Ramlibacter agri TaxID=2728837 RepID=A0A848HDN0_9BURK|nr:CapA family protein [Ramlibacter agri]NML47579.1 CapA family protein [Ramlibacter agri]